MDPTTRLVRIARSSAGACLLLFACAGNAGAETAQYRVTFESTWSASSHPYEFPANAHFSGLVGGTHAGQVSFWQPGGLASQGIQDMAEQGSKTALLQEVQAAIGSGTANAVLSGPGMSPSPGTVTMTFDVDDAYPLVTLVSMIAPSPDWFVGVTGLPLRANGQWIPRIDVDLHVFDAGTDSGLSYGSPNQVTSPHVPIAENTTGAFAGGNVVGTFTFVRTALLDVPREAPRGALALESVGPNPFRGAARFRFSAATGRAVDLTVYDVRGQRVRTLYRGQPFAEPREIGWDGRTDRGASAPAGLYFVALRADGGPAHTLRVALVR